MLTNTLLLYMTQEALAKARQRLTARKDAAPPQRHGEAVPPAWQQPRRRRGKAAGQSLRH